MILAIDTAGPVIGVGLLGRSGFFQRFERVERGSETRLVPWVRALCGEAGVALSDVDGIAVARGPGAFTGLRVGIATAVGLAMSLGRPIHGAMSLDSRARAHPGALVLLDARKGRVYAQAPGHDVADVDPDVAIAWVRAPFLATGEGAIVYRERIEAAGGVVAADADDPALRALAELGAEALARGEGIDATALVPYYLRDADARRPG